VAPPIFGRATITLGIGSHSSSSSFFFLLYGRPVYQMRTLFFALLCGFFYLLSFFFFPRLISGVADWMTAILAHMVCGLSANSGCKFGTCCMRLAENTGRKKSPKIRNLRTIAQLCRAISSQPRHTHTRRVPPPKYLLRRPHHTTSRHAV